MFCRRSDTAANNPHVRAGAMARNCSSGSNCSGSKLAARGSKQTKRLGPCGHIPHSEQLTKNAQFVICRHVVHPVPRHAVVSGFQDEGSLPAL